VVVNGKVEARPVMYVALTYDHRLIDGREAVTFLKKIKQVISETSFSCSILVTILFQALEDPVCLLLEL